MEITKNPIYKVQVFEMLSNGKTKSRIIRLYGVMGKKAPKLNDVTEKVRAKMREADGIVIKG